MILEEERSRDFVLGLVDQAIAFDHRGDINASLEASERALGLAECLDDMDLLVRVLSTRGRTLALRVDPGPGVEMLDGAVRLAESNAVKDELCAETHVETPPRPFASNPPLHAVQSTGQQVGFPGMGPPLHQLRLESWAVVS